MTCMLPKSRILSALLVGLGVALMVAGLVVPRFYHADARLPLDLENTTWTISDPQAQTRLLTDPDGRVLESPVTQQFHMEIQQPADADSAGVRIGSTLVRDSQQEDRDRLITASTWNYPMDRVTGEALGPADLTHTIGMPPAQVPVEGVWLKFPTDTQQTTYEVFDQTLRRAEPATFIDEVNMDGRSVYHFEQVIEPTNVALEYAGVFNSTDIDGERADLYYSATKDYYVDQVTGLVVDLHVLIDAYYATDEDVRETYLLFDGQRDAAQVESTLAEVSGVRSQSASDTIRWIVVGIGGVIVLVGLVGAFTSRRKRRNGDVDKEGNVEATGSTRA